jgi:hypothetical protein
MIKHTTVMDRIQTDMIHNQPHCVYRSSSSAIWLRKPGSAAHLVKKFGKTQVL